MDLSFLHAMILSNHHLRICRISYSAAWYSTQYCFWPGNSLHSQRSMRMGPQSWNPLVLTCSPASLRNQTDSKNEWTCSFEETIAASIQGEVPHIPNISELLNMPNSWIHPSPYLIYLLITSFGHTQICLLTKVGGA